MKNVFSVIRNLTLKIKHARQDIRSRQEGGGLLSSNTKASVSPVKNTARAKY